MTLEKFKERFGHAKTIEEGIALVVAALENNEAAEKAEQYKNQGWANAKIWMERCEKAEAELTELRSVNRYHRGHSDGYKEATEKLQVEIDQLKGQLATANNKGWYIIEENGGMKLRVCRLNPGEESYQVYVPEHALDEIPELKAEIQDLKEQLKGMLAAGGYEYFQGRIKQAEESAHNARYVAEQLKTQLASTEAELEKMKERGVRLAIKHCEISTKHDQMCSDSR